MTTIAAPAASSEAVADTSADDAAPPFGRRFRTELERVLRAAAGGALAGTVSGLLVGGVGGRLAMRVVALQTAPGYQGLRTDDGATTGEVTLTGTAGLIAFLTIVGAFGGLAYAVGRHLLPERGRMLLTALVTGALIGSVLIHADGVDYRVLGSRWVSVAMFAAVAAGYGAVLAALAERLLRPDGWARRSRPSRLAPVAIVFLPALSILPLALGLGGLAAVRATGVPAKVPTRPVVVLGRVVVGLLVAANLLDLWRTIGDLA